MLSHVGPKQYKMHRSGFDPLVSSVQSFKFMRRERTVDTVCAPPMPFSIHEPVGVQHIRGANEEAGLGISHRTRTTRSISAACRVRAILVIHMQMHICMYMDMQMHMQMDMCICMHMQMDNGHAHALVTYLCHTCVIL